MQAIPEVFGTGISPYNGIGYKLKIDPIPVSCYRIAYDPDAIAFPAMYAVPALQFRFTACR